MNLRYHDESLQGTYKRTITPADRKEWNSNGGIGNSDMSREKRLRWTGMRETQNVPIPAKHVWVTIGARWGDERLSAYVDPRKPAEMGPDINESKKRSL
ncbi:hypothetical protein QBC46DRAFT_421095 [Diplogelasinospora grovesii]|uniref:Uncharacterized protein n=1 Tax=Diplogelasinospora grovesii TaxID=303347 RepID=A0AAN6N1S8_9PEZI|nr:hypothetical protein QBC46DRAFT_421095 [Diplogelasinospora grovesii]